MRENYKLFVLRKSVGECDMNSDRLHVNINLDEMFLIFRKSSRMFLLAFLLLLSISRLSAQTNDDCLSCHDDASLSTTRAGKKVSLYIKPNALEHSVHKNIECAACHTDAAVTDFPHPENLKPVNCGICHEDAKDKYFRGVHGQAFLANEKFAPSCKELSWNS